MPTDYSLCIWMCVSIDTQTCCQDIGVIPIIIKRKLKTKHRTLTLKLLTNLKNSTNFNELNKCHPSLKSVMQCLLLLKIISRIIFLRLYIWIYSMSKV